MLDLKFNHRIFSLIGLRPAVSQHTEAEDMLLRKYAAKSQVIVEIGVFEGASAESMRKVAPPDAILHLIDPYPAGRLPGFSSAKSVAHKRLSKVKNASVQWIQDFSYNVAKKWNSEIDFLFIDGDHTYEGCRTDWDDWHSFIKVGGCVAFHDSRFFEDGWTNEDTGSLRVVGELFRNSSVNGWKIIDEIDSITVVQRLL